MMRDLVVTITVVMRMNDFGDSDDGDDSEWCHHSTAQSVHQYTMTVKVMNGKEDDDGEG
jgi:hypothetical protein